MPRHIIWRRQYDETRYLRGLSNAELNARARDTVLNHLVLREDGKRGLIDITEETRHWPEVFTHVLEEMQLRYGPYPAGFTIDARPQLGPFPDFVGDLARRAAGSVAAHRRDGASFLVKFGKRAHMRALLTRGSLRVQAASFYLGQNLNAAMRDDELHLSFSFALSREKVVRLVVNPRAVTGDAPEQRIDTQFRAPGDYWIYCVSASVAPPLVRGFRR